MKAILSTTIMALFSTALAGCWTYSRPDLETGCQKTSYGLAKVWVNAQDCGLDAAPMSDGPPARTASATTVTTVSAAR